MVITTDVGACHAMFVVSLGSLLLQFTSKKIHGGNVVKVLP
jgi:hypothetical protein